MRTILGTCDGFTPIIDVVADKMGLIPAAVYGVVWRYCQMRDGVCYATLETLAGHLGCDAATIQRHIRKLCEQGYIRDMTPSLRNSAHEYEITSRLNATAFEPSGTRQRFKAKPTPSHVYAIEAGEYVKIGVTNNLRSRVKSLAAIPPFPLKTLGSMKVQRPFDVEQALFEMFIQDRARGEWFILSKTKMAWLRGWLNESPRGEI
jgi:hypothetical protein